MTDRELDALVAATAPIDDAAVAVLPLTAGEADLREALMSVEPTPSDVEPNGGGAPAPVVRQPSRDRRAPRRRTTILVGLTATVAAVVVALTGVLGGGSTTSGTAWAAPLVRFAESSPLLLLDAPGWTVIRADEQSPVEGEMRFGRGGDSADLNWRRGSLKLWQRDRAHDSSLVETHTVLGARAQITQYTGTNDFTAIWAEEGRVLEFRSAATAGKQEFLRLTAALRRVDVDRWLTAMPASVVQVSGRPEVVRQMLTGIPLPKGFDAARLEDGQLLKERYQLGAAVSGAVACAWVRQWSQARAAHDIAAEQQAERAMASARSWPILREMNEQGDYSKVLWGYADALRGDGRWAGRPLEGDVESGLGCAANGEPIPGAVSPNGTTGG